MAGARISKEELNSMSLQELKEMRDAVETALASLERRQKAAALAAIEAKAREFGFSLSELQNGKRSDRKKSSPKYRNPANPDETWTGRGRQPQWMKDALAAGQIKDQFAI